MREEEERREEKGAGKRREEGREGRREEGREGRMRGIRVASCDDL